MSGFHWCNDKNESSSTSRSPKQASEDDCNPLITIRADGVYISYFQHRPHESTGRRIVFHVKDIEVIDNIPSSTWKQFFGAQTSNVGRARESESKMLQVDVCSIRQGLDKLNEEYRVEVSDISSMSVLSYHLRSLKDEGLSNSIPHRPRCSECTFELCDSCPNYSGT
jgi:hypothetical protein